MAEESQEDYDKKFKELFPEPHFQPEFYQKEGNAPVAGTKLQPSPLIRGAEAGMGTMLLNRLNAGFPNAQTVSPTIAPSQPSIVISPTDVSRASGAKLPGESANLNYTRAEAGQNQRVPFAVQSAATNYRKDNPTGAHFLIGQDEANEQKQKNIGLGGYQFSGEGKQEMILPPEVAEERNKKLARLTPMQKMAIIKERLINKLPDRLSPLANAFGVANFQDMANRLEQTPPDITGAAISGLGGVGSLATYVPYKPVSVAGRVVSLGAPALNAYRDEEKKKK
jgi:hypothetical protein